MDIKITPYNSIEDVVNEALHKAKSDTMACYLGFVGDIDTIQAILAVVLKDTGCLIDSIDIDVCDNNIYQLTISEGGFVSVVPIKNECGDYLIIDADIRYVSDEIPLSYFSRLNACGEKYTVFGFDYDDELSDEEAEDLLGNADIAVIYDKYSQLPENYQQLVDLILDWGLN